MLEGAAQHLFTFLRYSGMPSHNNAAELGTRDPVGLHRNVRHRLSEPEGWDVFPVSVSVARACHKWGCFRAWQWRVRPGIRTGAYSSRPNRNLRSASYRPPPLAGTEIVSRARTVRFSGFGSRTLFKTDTFYSNGEQSERDPVVHHRGAHYGGHTAHRP